MKLLLKSTLAVVAVCALAATASAQKADNKLRWASNPSINAVDPYYNAFREATIVNAQMVWDTLVHKTPAQTAYQPLLAESWEWVDDKTLRFKLREDVVFHDGKPLTAADAVYTYNYVSNPDNKINVQSNVNWIDHAEQVDEYTFLMHLRGPFPPALEYLSSLLPILPDGFYGDNMTAGSNGRLVGTGPYKIVGFEPGASISLEKHDGYFENSPKGMPSFDAVEYRTIPDRATQIAELMSGGVDWIWRVPEDFREQLQAVPTVEVNTTETMRIGYLALNTQKAGDNPLKDVRVRRAVAHAINRPLIVENVVGAGSSVVDMACFRTQFGCVQDVASYEYDPQKTKELLAEAGYPDGISLSFGVIQSNAEWGAAITGSLESSGINISTEVTAYSAWREKVINNTIDVAYGSWGSYSINDVSAILNNFFRLGPDDMAQDAEISAALDRAAQTPDQVERAKAFEFALQRIAEQAYWVPLWVHPVSYAFDSDLNFQPFADENPRLYLSSWK